MMADDPRDARGRTAAQRFSDRIPWSPDKAAAWQALWRAEHARRWQPCGGKLVPVLVEPGAPGDPREPHSAPVIRALELQINPARPEPLNARSKTRHEPPRYRNYPG